METITFEIFFITEYWKDPATVKITIDDQIKFIGPITADGPITFTETLTFGLHQLKIHRTGKTNEQVGADKGQHVIIDKIKIDGVNIRDLIWIKSYYVPEYPEPWATNQRDNGIVLEEKVPGETFLGHNGVWNFEFKSPFYRFIMDWMG